VSAKGRKPSAINALSTLQGEGWVCLTPDEAERVRDGLLDLALDALGALDLTPDEHRALVQNARTLARTLLTPARVA
jgi:hypothetical protein